MNGEYVAIDYSSQTHKNPIVKVICTVNGRQISSTRKWRKLYPDAFTVTTIINPDTYEAPPVTLNPEERLLHTPEIRSRFRPWNTEGDTDFLDLVFQVNDFNYEAAKYLLLNPHNNCGYLAGWTSWSSTPQGYRYWHNIGRQLNNPPRANTSPRTIADYADLVLAVALKDANAARYLVLEAPNLPHCSRDYDGKVYNLFYTFIWRDSPQDWDYWNRINTYLETNHNYA